MHQKKLSLLKKEISLIYKTLNPLTKTKLDVRLCKMLYIPGFSSFAVFLEYTTSFKAKNWISIAKCILIVCKGKVCLFNLNITIFKSILCKSFNICLFLELIENNNFHSIKLYIEYLNILTPWNIFLK